MDKSKNQILSQLIDYIGTQLWYVVRMIFHPNEHNEFSCNMNVAREHMVLPSQTKDDRQHNQKYLNIAVSELSEKTFKLNPIAEQIMAIIDMKEETCREYSNTESQVNVILSWLPRFKDHRKLLTEEVAKHRKEYRLKV